MVRSHSDAITFKVGDHIYVQNFVGNHPKKWERSDVITEVRQLHQYVVRIDGSGRVTLRSRQYLRKFSPFKKAVLARNLLMPPLTSPHNVRVAKTIMQLLGHNHPLWSHNTLNHHHGGNLNLSYKTAWSCNLVQSNPWPYLTVPSRQTIKD